MKVMGSPPTLGLMLETALGTIAYLVTIVALVAITLRSLELYRRIKAGQPDPTRGNQKLRRLSLMVREVLTHAKMLNFTGSGIAHWFVMIGFVSLFGTLVTAYGQIFDPHFVLPIIGSFTPYNLFVELITWLTGVSIVALIAIRQVTRISKKIFLFLKNYIVNFLRNFFKINYCGIFL